MSIHSEFMAEIDQIQKQYDADCAKIQAKFESDCSSISDRLDAQVEETERNRDEIKDKLAALTE